MYCFICCSTDCPLNTYITMIQGHENGGRRVKTARYVTKGSEKYSLVVFLKLPV